MVLCSCAGTLVEALDLEAVGRCAARLPGVEVAEVREVLCSADGLAALAAQAARRGWKRVVLGACTAEEHGAQFQEALAEAGVHPHLTWVANLREQCAWVGGDRARATEQACALIAAAVARVSKQQPLARRTLPACPAVAVLGGGAAGLATALTLADGGRQVTLVEREHCLGGRAYRYAELYPERECGACRLAPPVDAVLHHPRITVLTGAALVRCRGREGDFRLAVEQAPRGVEVAACLGCGACSAACSATLPGGGAAIRPPFDGALPYAPVVDPAHCLRQRGESCEACMIACPTGAARPGSLADPATVSELAVGAVVVATGFSTFDPAQDARFGYSAPGCAVRRVWTAPELEERLADAEPWQECGGPPARVTLVHCVGSRSPRFHPHCSGICCAYLGKHAAQLADRLPGVALTDLYVDHCLPGRREESLFRSALTEAGAELRRRRHPDDLEVRPGPFDVRVRYARPDGGWDEFSSDLVVLAPALVGPLGSGPLAALLDVGRVVGGWFAEDAEFLARAVATRPGVFLAGGCRAPGSVGQAVADGLAAAGQVFRHLVPGRLLAVDPAVAVVETARCSGCGACRAACDYGAVTLDPAGVARVDDTLCRGCGSCAAACPAGALEQLHATASQVRAETDALVGLAPGSGGPGSDRSAVSGSDRG